MNRWSEWRPFPNPSKGDYLLAPFGPGVYELRHRSTGKLILVGQSKNVAWRMSSLLPAPPGCGKRDNEKKRNHVHNNLADIEYRTRAYLTKAEAEQAEALLKAENLYMFSEQVQR